MERGRGGSVVGQASKAEISALLAGRALFATLQDESASQVLVAFQAPTVWFQRLTTRCQKPGAPVPETSGLWSGLRSTPEVRGLGQK